MPPKTKHLTPGQIASLVPVITRCSRRVLQRAVGSLDLVKTPVDASDVFSAVFAKSKCCVALKRDSKKGDMFVVCDDIVDLLTWMIKLGTDGLEWFKKNIKIIACYGFEFTVVESGTVTTIKYDGLVVAFNDLAKFVQYKQVTAIVPTSGCGEGCSGGGGCGCGCRAVETRMTAGEMLRGSKGVVFVEKADTDPSTIAGLRNSLKVVRTECLFLNSAFGKVSALISPKIDQLLDEFMVYCRRQNESKRPELSYLRIYCLVDLASRLDVQFRGKPFGIANLIETLPDGNLQSTRIMPRKLSFDESFVEETYGAQKIIDEYNGLYIRVNKFYHEVIIKMDQLRDVNGAICHMMNDTEWEEERVRRVLAAGVRRQERDEHERRRVQERHRIQIERSIALKNAWVENALEVSIDESSACTTTCVSCLETKACFKTCSCVECSGFACRECITELWYIPKSGRMPVSLNCPLCRRDASLDHVVRLIPALGPVLEAYTVKKAGVDMASNIPVACSECSGVVFVPKDDECRPAGDEDEIVVTCKECQDKLPVDIKHCGACKSPLVRFDGCMVVKCVICKRYSCALCSNEINGHDQVHCLDNFYGSVCSGVKSSPFTELLPGQIITLHQNYKEKRAEKYEDHEWTIDYFPDGRYGVRLLVAPKTKKDTIVSFDDQPIHKATVEEIIEVMKDERNHCTYDRDRAALDYTITNANAGCGKIYWLFFGKLKIKKSDIVEAVERTKGTGLERDVRMLYRSMIGAINEHNADRNAEKRRARGYNRR